MSFYRSKYLHSDHWKTKRSEAILKRGQKCELCGKKNGLDVHHLTYCRLFGEKLTDVRIVCRSCHDQIHDLLKKYPKLKTLHNAKQWFIVWSRIRKTKPPPSVQAKMNQFGICRYVLMSLKLAKHKRMPWRPELAKAKIRYRVPILALAQYMKITGLDPRYRADRVGSQRLLTWPVSR